MNNIATNIPKYTTNYLCYLLTILPTYRYILPTTYSTHYLYYLHPILPTTDTTYYLYYLLPILPTTYTTYYLYYLFVLFQAMLSPVQIGIVTGNYVLGCSGVSCVSKPRFWYGLLDSSRLDSCRLD